MLSPIAKVAGVNATTGAMPTPATPESVWPTQEWRTSSPEEEGMDSKELAADALSENNAVKLD